MYETATAIQDNVLNSIKSLEVLGPKLTGPQTLSIVDFLLKYVNISCDNDYQPDNCNIYCGLRTGGEFHISFYDSNGQLRYSIQILADGSYEQLVAIPLLDNEEGYIYYDEGAEEFCREHYNVYEMKKQYLNTILNYSKDISKEQLKTALDFFINYLSSAHYYYNYEIYFDEGAKNLTLTCYKDTFSFTENGSDYKQKFVITIKENGAVSAVFSDENYYDHGITEFIANYKLVQ